jgi:hypothetical protein
LLVLSPFGFQPQIQAGFHGSPFNYYPYGALPYKYVKPVEGQQRAFGTTISSVFNALVPSNLKWTFTSTIFSTFFTVVTSKSTATCRLQPTTERPSMGFTLNVDSDRLHLIQVLETLFSFTY